MPVRRLKGGRVNTHMHCIGFFRVRIITWGMRMRRSTPHMPRLRATPRAPAWPLPALLMLVKCWFSLQRVALVLNTMPWYKVCKHPDAAWVCFWRDKVT